MAVPPVRPVGLQTEPSLVANNHVVYLSPSQTWGVRHKIAYRLFKRYANAVTSENGIGWRSWFCETWKLRVMRRCKFEENDELDWNNQRGKCKNVNSWCMCLYNKKLYEIRHFHGFLGCGWLCYSRWTPQNIVYLLIVYFFARPEQGRNDQHWSLSMIWPWSMKK